MRIFLCCVGVDCSNGINAAWALIGKKNKCENCFNIRWTGTCKCINNVFVWHLYDKLFRTVKRTTVFVWWHGFKISSKFAKLLLNWNKSPIAITEFFVYKSTWSCKLSSIPLIPIKMLKYSYRRQTVKIDKSKGNFEQFFANYNTCT